MMDLHVAPGIVARVERGDRRGRRMLERVLGPLPAAPGGDERGVIEVRSASRGIELRPDGIVVLGGGGDHLVATAVAVAALAGGHLLVHAATVATGGAAALFAGPSGAGKTAAMLAASAGGADIVAPEWVCLGEDGGVVAVPGRVRLRPHHLDGPSAWPERLPVRARLRLRATAALARIARGVPRVSAALEHRRIVDVAAPEPPDRPIKLAVLLMLRASTVDQPRVHPLAQADAARSLADLLREDLSAASVVGDSTGAASAERVRALVDGSLEERIEAILRRGPVKCVMLEHDHPASGDALGVAIADVMR